tara:strand:+ start:23156 stop:24061 length:906 start_codon:yes stop_codon:yes gene_type:complete
MKKKFLDYIYKLQEKITSSLEQLDGESNFKEDIWKRPEGGGGKSKVLENGRVFEKAGVNVSAVNGVLPESLENYFGVTDSRFFACGLSLVIHPKNPMVPTVHANYRYFELYTPDGELKDQWFGGGQDLTPFYLIEEDAVHFHKICKLVCDKHSSSFYNIYKEKCDSYFWNHHRNESRGIGGLFFDYLKTERNYKIKDWFSFVTDVGDSFLDAYLPIVNNRKNYNYSSDQKKWQEIRRGRYVEFNLVHDKGTLFGLKTNGRIESVLMSLPPKVQWVYDHVPEKGSEEDKLIHVLQNPRSWTT